MTNFGSGVITNDPMFVSTNAMDYRLQYGSPCINSGTNVPNTATDLDGNPRIIGGTVDMGAYEYVPEPFTVIGYQLSVIVVLIFASRSKERKI